MNKEKTGKEIMTTTVFSWLLLIILTFVAVYLSNFIDSRDVFISCALILVFFKGQQIIDIFMELKHAPKRWRLLLLSYVILMPLIIASIYLF